MATTTSKVGATPSPPSIGTRIRSAVGSAKRKTGKALAAAKRNLAKARARANIGIARTKAKAKYKINTAKRKIGNGAAKVARVARKVGAGVKAGATAYSNARKPAWYKTGKSSRKEAAKTAMRVGKRAYKNS